MWQKFISLENTYGENKKCSQNLSSKCHFYKKKPLDNYIKGHRIHDGNEAYFFGYQIPKFISIWLCALDANKKYMAIN
jgi:hypothetical protein